MNHSSRTVCALGVWCFVFWLVPILAEDCRNTRMSCNTYDVSAGLSQCCVHNPPELRCGSCGAAGGAAGRNKECNPQTGVRCAHLTSIENDMCANDDLGPCGADVPNFTCAWGFCPSE